MTDKISKPIIQKYSSGDEFVIDPFCGSGNVLKTAMLLGRNGVGVDINPLAVLISKVSTRKYDIDMLRQTLNNIIENIRPEEPPRSFIIENGINYWFTFSALSGIYSIKNSIDRCADKQVNDFFKVALSSIVRKVSKADPSIPPPVYSKKMRESKIRYGFDDVVKKFIATANLNLRKAEVLSNRFSERNYTDIYRQNSIDFLRQSKRKVDLVLTSPPYIAAQKYTRSTSLELMTIIGLSRHDLSDIDRIDIGSENLLSKEFLEYPHNTDLIEVAKPEQGVLINRFMDKMDTFFTFVGKVLNENGHIAMIIGNNTINGKVVPVSNAIMKLASSHSLRVKESYEDEIKNYSFFTKRNKNAGMIKKEHIMIFSKE